jgi:hypothetical protein
MPKAFSHYPDLSEQRTEAILMKLHMERFGDRMSAMFGRRGRVFFEIREENVPSSVKIESLRMYEKKGKEARSLGKIVYAIHPDKRVEIQGFHVEDWAEKNQFPYRMLKWFVHHMRKRRMIRIEGGIFSTDTKTGDKLDVFKTQGFNVREMGAMAGHIEYHVEMEL